MDICPREGFISDHNNGIDRAAAVCGTTPEDIESLNETIEWSQELAARLNLCEICGGMAVDLATGKMYCGREIPTEVIANNEAILNN